MNINSKIFVAGHNGLVGSSILRKLQSLEFKNIITKSRSNLNLMNQKDVELFFNEERPEYVFLAAAKVGGIHANYTYPAEFIYNNLAIQNNIIISSFKTNVKKLMFLGSSCIYPKLSPQPIKEKYLLTSPLEETNEPYAIAKIAGIKMCESFNKQYGTDYISVMPNNLYGPNDNFDLNNSHVLPALIRKFHLANLAKKGNWEEIKADENYYGNIPHDFLKNLISISMSEGFVPKSQETKLNETLPEPSVKLWGTGNPKRELLYVDDLADACVFLMQKSKKELNEIPIINVGTGKDQSINTLANLVAEVIGYSGKILWDKTKPDGTPRKLLDTSKLTNLGWKSKISLKEGINLTYEAYKNNLLKSLKNKQ